MRPRLARVCCPVCPLPWAPGACPANVLLGRWRCRRLCLCVCLAQIGARAPPAPPPNCAFVHRLCASARPFSPGPQTLPYSSPPDFPLSALALSHAPYSLEDQRSSLPLLFQPFFSQHMHPTPSSKNEARVCPAWLFGGRRRGTLQAVAWRRGLSPCACMAQF